MPFLDYEIGIYVRESRDDNEESYDTVETQRDLLIDYVNKNELGRINNIYIDDNVSGTQFTRLGLDRLKEDVVSNRVNLILLKDLSRLGRNNAKTLLFLDFLEEYGVRVITYDGRYDSRKDNDTVGIETWFNERYVRDISAKIRANLWYKIKKGEYLGSAPYGYIKSRENKNTLVLKDEEAKIVKEIYKMYSEGMGYSYIGRKLNERGVRPPSGKLNGKWNSISIRRILTNEVYIGNTVQGISEKISFKSKKTRRRPKDKWIITKNTHEPVISKDIFYQIQEIKEKRNKNLQPHKGVIHIYRGVMKCAGCGSLMQARKRNGRPMGYICSKYAKYGIGACSSHYIREEELNSYFQKLCMTILENELNIQSVLKIINDDKYNKKYLNLVIDYKRKLEQKLHQQEIIYTDMLEGNISRELFNRMNIGIDNSIRILNDEIMLLESKNININLTGNQLIQDLKNNVKKYGITNAAIISLVEKIMVLSPDDEYDGIKYEDIPQTKLVSKKDYKNKSRIILYLNI